MRELLRESFFEFLFKPVVNFTIGGGIRGREEKINFFKYLFGLFFELLVALCTLGWKYYTESSSRIIVIHIFLVSRKIFNSNAGIVYGVLKAGVETIAIMDEKYFAVLLLDNWFAN